MIPLITNYKPTTYFIPFEINNKIGYKNIKKYRIYDYPIKIANHFLVSLKMKEYN